MGMVVGGAAARFRHSEFHRKREEELKKRKAALVAQRRRDEATAVSFLAQLSPDSDQLSRELVVSLLQQVVGRADIDEDGLDLVMAYAREIANADLGEESLQPGDAMPKTAVLAALDKYRYYMRNKPRVDKLFAEWDLDLSNGLDRRELRKLIIDKERNLREKRQALGVIIEVFPDDVDIDFIMESCDTNANGTIGRSELLPALAIWEEIAAQKVEKQNSCPCVVL